MLTLLLTEFSMMSPKKLTYFALTCLLASSFPAQGIRWWPFGSDEVPVVITPVVPPPTPLVTEPTFVPGLIPAAVMVGTGVAVGVVTYWGLPHLQKYYVYGKNRLKQISPLKKALTASGAALVSAYVAWQLGCFDNKCNVQMNGTSLFLTSLVGWLSFDKMFAETPAQTGNADLEDLNLPINQRISTLSTNLNNLVGRVGALEGTAQDYNTFKQTVNLAALNAIKDEINQIRRILHDPAQSDKTHAAVPLQNKIIALEASANKINQLETSLNNLKTAALNAIDVAAIKELSQGVTSLSTNLNTMIQGLKDQEIKSCNDRITDLAGKIPANLATTLTAYGTSIAKLENPVK